MSRLGSAIMLVCACGNHKPEDFTFEWTPYNEIVDPCGEISKYDYFTIKCKCGNMLLYKNAERWIEDATGVHLGKVNEEKIRALDTILEKLERGITVEEGESGSLAYRPFYREKAREEIIRLFK